MMDSEINIQPSDLELDQGNLAYRFSIDAFLVAAFASRYKPEYILDMGTGCGVVAWQMAQLNPGIKGKAVEFQPEFIPLAQKNLDQTGINVVHGDMCNVLLGSDIYDMLVSNPPYFRPGHGKLSKNPVKALARHTLKGDVADWVVHASGWLKKDGFVCVIYPSRFCTLIINKMENNGFYLNETIDISSFQDQAPKLSCLAFSRTPGQLKSSRLVLYQAHRKRTPEAVKFLEGTLQETIFL